VNDKIIFFQGEVQLLSWGDTSTRGRTITLQLPEEGEEHPFKHSQIKQGKTAGKRYVAVFVEIDESEQPVEKTPSQMAFLYCNDELFWEWCNERSLDHIGSAEEARSHMLSMLSAHTEQLVLSRGDIDRRPVVRAAFEYLIEQPFIAWRADRKVEAVV
jgi:hypothetical protein